MRKLKGGKNISNVKKNYNNLIKPKPRGKKKGTKNTKSNIKSSTKSNTKKKNNEVNSVFNYSELKTKNIKNWANEMNTKKTKEPAIPRKCQKWIKSWLHTQGYKFNGPMSDAAYKNKDPATKKQMVKINTGKNTKWYRLRDSKGQFLSQGNKKNPYTWIRNSKTTLNKLKKAQTRANGIIALEELFNMLKIPLKKNKKNKTNYNKSIIMLN